MTKKLILGLLGVAVVIFLFSPYFLPVPLPLEEIHVEALEMIEESKLDPVLRNFIELAKQNKTVGRPVSEFSPEFWALAYNSDSNSPDKRYRWYEFLPPMTEKAERYNSESEGVVYWPKLAVQVDPKQQIIIRVILYKQGL